MEETSKEPHPTLSLALMKAHVPVMELVHFSQAQALSAGPAELSPHGLARERGARYVVEVTNQ